MSGEIKVVRIVTAPPRLCASAVPIAPRSNKTRSIRFLSVTVGTSWWQINTPDRDGSVFGIMSPKQIGCPDTLNGLGNFDAIGALGRERISEVWPARQC